MENVNKYLSEDADEEARAAAQRLEEGFAALRLQEKVKGAAAGRARMQQQSRWRMLLGILIVLILLLLGWWWTKQETLPEEMSTPESTSEIAPPSQEEEAVPLEEAPQEEQQLEETQAPPPPPPRNVPIAQAPQTPSLSPPPYGAPDTYLRGQAEQIASKELLDQLWYTEYPLAGLAVDIDYERADQLLRERSFPLAYVSLQRLDRQLVPNDTLRYLQAYTLLEMGQGPEATALFEQMEQPAATWTEQLQWYRGLALLLDEQTEAALVIFRDIAAQPKHLYRQQAEKAVNLYK